MIELTSNDYLLCNYVIWLIDAFIMHEGNIHAVHIQGGSFRVHLLVSLIYGN